MPRTPNAPLNERDALTIPEAAADASVSTGTMRAWINAGQIPLSRLPAPGGGAMPRILRADLLAFLIKYRDNVYPLPPALAGRSGNLTRRRA